MIIKFKPEQNGYNRAEVKAYFSKAKAQAHEARARYKKELQRIEELLLNEREVKQEYIEKLLEAEAEISRLKIDSGIQLTDDPQPTPPLSSLYASFKRELNGYNRNDVINYLETLQQNSDKRFAHLTAQLEDAEKRLIAEEEEKGRYFERVFEAEAEISSLKIKTGVTHTHDLEENNDLQNEVEKYKKQNHALAEDIEYLEDELSKLKQQKSSAISGEDIDENFKALVQEIDDLQNELSNLKKELAEKNTAFDKQLKTVEQEKEDLQDELTASKKQISDLESKLEEAEELLSKEQELKQGYIDYMVEAEHSHSDENSKDNTDKVQTPPPEDWENERNELKEEITLLEQEIEALITQLEEKK